MSGTLDLSAHLACYFMGLHRTSGFAKLLPLHASKPARNRGFGETPLARSGGVFGTLVPFPTFVHESTFVSEQFWGRAARASRDSNRVETPVLFLGRDGIFRLTGVNVVVYSDDQHVQVFCSTDTSSPTRFGMTRPFEVFREAKSLPA